MCPRTVGTTRTSGKPAMRCWMKIAATRLATATATKLSRAARQNTGDRFADSVALGSKPSAPSPPALGTRRKRAGDGCEGIWKSDDILLSQLVVPIEHERREGSEDDFEL